MGRAVHIAIIPDTAIARDAQNIKYAHIVKVKAVHTVRFASIVEVKVVRDVLIHVRLIHVRLIHVRHVIQSLFVIQLLRIHV
jgi:hypothetical protein